MGPRPLTARNDTATQNHSVVQGDFNSPCRPSNPAIYSGFIPSHSGPAVSPNTRDPAETTTKAAKTNFPIPSAPKQNTSFVLTINDTKPIWYYCSQAKHCQAGMVGVINP